jgi:hypothetical protein
VTLGITMKGYLISGWAIATTLLGPVPSATHALPPPSDVPEEVLRNEIILEARSPLTGEPLTPAEYAELQATLRDRSSPLLASEIRELIFLLQLRRVFRPIIPFLP